MSRKCRRALARILSERYGRSYLPLATGDSTLTVGSILENADDTVPLVHGSVMGVKPSDLANGSKENLNLKSSSSMQVEFKPKGQASHPDLFKLEEAGLVVRFSGDGQVFLKVIGIRQQNLKDFLGFQRKVLEGFVEGSVTADMHIVRGLVVADRYLLQCGRKRDGLLALKLKASDKVKGLSMSVDADFSIKAARSPARSITRKRDLATWPSSSSTCIFSPPVPGCLAMGRSISASSSRGPPAVMAQ